MGLRWGSDEAQDAREALRFLGNGFTVAPSLLGEVTHYVADTSKAKQLLGFAPQVPLDDGIGRAVAWFQEHRGTHPEEDEWVFSLDSHSPQDAEPGWKPGRAAGAVA